MQNTATFNLRLAEDELDMLRELAEHRRMSAAHVLRESIRREHAATFPDSEPPQRKKRAPAKTSMKTAPVVPPKPVREAPKKPAAPVRSKITHEEIVRAMKVIQLPRQEPSRRFDPRDYPARDPRDFVRNAPANDPPAPPAASEDE